MSKKIATCNICGEPMPKGEEMFLFHGYSGGCPISPVLDKAPLFKQGDLVRKKKGSNWQGLIVGFYSTKLTPIGYVVESEGEIGSVQIYPEVALEKVIGSKEIVLDYFEVSKKEVETTLEYFENIIQECESLFFPPRGMNKFTNKDKYIIMRKVFANQLATISNKLKEKTNE